MSVICLMTGKVVSELSTPKGNTPLDLELSAMNETETTYTPIQVATIMSFAIGLWEVCF